MSFPDLFKRAIGLWWRTRALWPLGVLAALFGAGDYATSNNFNFNYNVPAGDDGAAAGAAIEEWLSNPAIEALTANPTPFLIGLAAVLIIWGLVALLVGQLAHGAMIRVADLADQGFEARLGEALRVGAARMLPMVGLALIVGLPAILIVIGVFVLIFAVAGQLVAAGAGASTSPEALLLGVGGTLLCLIPLGLLAGLLGLVLSFFARLAQRACVLEGRGPIASLGRAWGLVRRNFGNAILTWLAALMLSASFGVLTSLPALALALPAMVGFMRSGEIPWGVLVVLLVYGFVASVLLGGWLTSFNSALWTVAYRSFVERDRAFAVPASYAPGD